MSDPDPWTSLVIAPGDDRHHGRDSREPTRTLCGEAEVTDRTLLRAPFRGGGERDCPRCAELLEDNHY